MTRNKRMLQVKLDNINHRWLLLSAATERRKMHGVRMLKEQSYCVKKSKNPFTIFGRGLPKCIAGDSSLTTCVLSSYRAYVRWFPPSGSQGSCPSWRLWPWPRITSWHLPTSSVSTGIKIYSRDKTSGGCMVIKKLSTGSFFQYLFITRDRTQIILFKDWSVRLHIGSI